MIEKIEVPASEILCTKNKERRVLSVPILLLSWFQAKNLCDRFFVDSMNGNFEVNCKILQ